MCIVELEGLYREAEAFLHDALPISDDCGTVTATFGSESFTMGSTQCAWTLNRIYTSSDGCAANNFDVTMVYSGGDEDPATGTTPAPVTDINACMSIAEIEGLYPKAADETALETAYTDDCGTVTATFGSESFTMGSTQCAWTLNRIYTISDGCAANNFDVTMVYSGGDDTAPAFTGTIDDTTVPGCDPNSAPDAETTVAGLEALSGDLEITDCAADGSLIVNYNDEVVSGPSPLVITRTYTITDPCTNVSDDIIHTITIDNSMAAVKNMSTGETFCTIQDAINDVQTLNGHTIAIRQGTYNENLDPISKDLTFAPGASPGCVTINGNMVLNNGDFLAMEIDGTTACSLYDQFIVNGTVTLGGSTLTLTLGYTPTIGDAITIIDNDMTDAVSGQFSQGAAITVGGYTFDIDYAGGVDGNDVVLTVCAGGVTNTNTGEIFCTIQDAVDDAQTVN